MDVYKALSNLLIIPVALNNIKYRSDINSLGVMNFVHVVVERSISVVVDDKSIWMFVDNRMIYGDGGIIFEKEKR